MSGPPICCVTTPSFWSALPPYPAMRNLSPFRSSTLRISLRNQPPIWLPVLPAGIATTPWSRYTSA